MTRDARLSALHRGGFSPGAALLSPAFAPDRLQRAPRSQVVVPGGRLPGPPETSGYKPPPQDATPRSAFRFALENAPSMSEAGNGSSIASNCSQVKTALCGRKAQALKKHPMACPGRSGTQGDDAWLPPRPALSAFTPLRGPVVPRTRASGIWV